MKRFLWAFVLVWGQAWGADWTERLQFWQAPIFVQLQDVALYAALTGALALPVLFACLLVTRREKQERRLGAILLTFMLAFWGTYAKLAGLIYWVDLSGTGTGAADGTSVSNLCAGATDTDCTPSAGDTVNFCNAGTVQFVPGVNGSSGNPIKYEWAPNGCAHGSIETSGATSGLSLGTRTYLTFNNVRLTQTGTARCVNIPGADDITFNDGRIGPCAQSGTGAEGAVVFSPSVDSDRVVFNRTYITNPTGNCIGLVNATGSIDYADLQFNDIELENCGDASAEHGIRLKVAAAASSTITRPVISGGSITTTYDYAIDLSGGNSTRTDNVIDPVISEVTIRDAGHVGPDTGSGGGAIRITNGLRPTINNNTLNENVGNGGGVVLLYSTNAHVYENKCSRTVSTGSQIDGGGIDVDHGNDGAIIERNYCADNDGNSTAVNSGYGIMVLDSTNTKVRSNILIGNKIGISYNPQISGGAGQNNEFYNNISCLNDRDGINVDSDTTANNSTWENNVLCWNGRYGFSVGDADSGQVANFNAYYGNATAASNNQNAGANDLTADPLFVGGTSPTTPDGFRLRCGSPLIRAGTDVGRFQDYGNRPFAIGTPSIGAWEMASGDERCTVTSRSTITTRSTITPRTTINAR